MREPSASARRGLRPLAAGLGLLALGLTLALAMMAAAEAAAGIYAQGQKVRITGVVTDTRGTPLTSVRVTLIAARSFFNVRQLKSSDKDPREIAATTDAKGEYSIEWPWDDYYNRFEIQVGLAVREGREEHTEVLARQDITQQLQKGTPVVPALVVQNAALIDKVRRFLASLTSDDLRRVYQEMGIPDDVKEVAYPDHTESSWWYFESGAMYRFESGRLAQVAHFTPVKPF